MHSIYTSFSYPHTIIIYCILYTYTLTSILYTCIGFCESRVLGYTRFLEYLPLKHPLHFYPVVSKTDKSNNSICYFIGFNIDSKQFIGKSDKSIYIDDCTSKFQ